MSGQFNLFLHYTFDVWMRKQFPDLQHTAGCPIYLLCRGLSSTVSQAAQ